MSLVQQVETPGSHMRTFMDAHLPGLNHPSNSIRDLYHATKPDLPPHIVTPEDGSRPDHNMLGAAIEQRLNWALTDVDAAAGIMPGAQTAIRALGRYAPRGTSRRQALEQALLSTGEQLARTLAETLPGIGAADRDITPHLDSDTEQYIGKLAVVTGWFDAAYHTSGRTVTLDTPIGALGPDCTLDKLLAAVPAYALKDIQTQLELIGSPTTPPIRSFAQLRADTSATDCHIHPTLEAEGITMRADPDIIADGLLLDIKSTTKPATLLSADLRQLAGYALLDFEDRYNLSKVGLYRSRNGYLFEMAIPDFLAGCQATDSLPGLRAKLYAHLLEAEPASREARIARFLAKMQANRRNS